MLMVAGCNEQNFISVLFHNVRCIYKPPI